MSILIREFALSGDNPRGINIPAVGSQEDVNRLTPYMFAWLAPHPLRIPYQQISDSGWRFEEVPATFIFEAMRRSEYRTMNWRTVTILFGDSGLEPPVHRRRFV